MLQEFPTALTLPSKPAFTFCQLDLDARLNSELWSLSFVSLWYFICHQKSLANQAKEAAFVLLQASNEKHFIMNQQVGPHSCLLTSWDQVQTPQYHATVNVPNSAVTTHQISAARSYPAQSKPLPCVPLYTILFKGQYHENSTHSSKNRRTATSV